MPACFFNSLLGELPLIGRLFSPERGGGRFAATCSMSGSFDDPAVTVNPLAALTPGLLCGVFGIFDGQAGGGGNEDGLALFATRAFLGVSNEIRKRQSGGDTLRHRA